MITMTHKYQARYTVYVCVCAFVASPPISVQSIVCLSVCLLMSQKEHVQISTDFYKRCLWPLLSFSMATQHVMYFWSVDNVMCP